MRVVQLAGRYKGKVITMPFNVATACISNGTACRPEHLHKVKVRGIDVAAIQKSLGIEPNEIADDAVVPENWEDMHHAKRISLAKRLGYKVSKAKDADKAIRKHLAN